jgi:acyl-CoA hydrolase
VGGNQDKIDLTGQATAESLGSSFYSGIGGQADLNQ